MWLPNTRFWKCLLAYLLYWRLIINERSNWIHTWITTWCLLLLLCLLSSHCFFPFIWHEFHNFAHPVSISMLKLFSKIYFFFNSSRYSLNIFSDMLFWQRRKKVWQRNIKQFQILTFFPVTFIFFCLFLYVISCKQKDRLCIYVSLDNAYIIVVTWKKRQNLS